MLDYHVHLWPHGERAVGPTLDQLAAYCEKAAASGVRELAVTEHLFRFVQANAALAGWWEDDPDPQLRATAARYWAGHAHADLDVYVATVERAKAAGLPVLLGLEVDHYRDRMDAVARVLEGYPFDVLLGSVHWLGAWLFDYLEDPTSAQERGRRGVDAVWDAYATAVEELAGSGVCDVLAHPDLIKVSGRRTAVPDEFNARLVEATAQARLVAEANSAGWRRPASEAYPAPALLARFRAAGVPVTMASDAHELPTVAHRACELRQLVADAGYDTLTAFRARTPRQVEI